VRWFVDDSFNLRLSVNLSYHVHVVLGVNRLLLHGRDLIYLTSP
jgi:hypothetical protein